MKKHFIKYKTGLFLFALLLANVLMYQATAVLFESKKDILVSEKNDNLNYYTKGIQIFSFGYSVIDYFHQVGDKKDR